MKPPTFIESAMKLQEFLADHAQGILAKLVDEAIARMSSAPPPKVEMAEQTGRIFVHPPEFEPAVAAMVEPQPRAARAFPCDLCSFIASRPRYLDAHRRMKHHKVPPALARLDEIRNRAAVVGPPSAPPTKRNIPDPFAPMPRDPEEEDDDVA